MQMGARLSVPLPAWMLKIGAFLRRTETELLLKNRRVIPSRLTESGFAFNFSHWPEASLDLVNRWRGKGSS